MKKIASWRWSRLFDKAAVKKVFKRWDLYPFLMFCLILIWIAHSTDSELNSNEAVFHQIWLAITWLSCITFIYVILETICAADEYYKIKLRTTVCRIYIYGNSERGCSEQDIIFKQDDTEARICTHRTSLKEKGYKFYHWGMFMYCLDGDNSKWYYFNQNSDEPQFLGKKLSPGRCFVFLSNVNEDGKLDLSVLNNQWIIHLEADSYVLNNAYVPPQARQNIKYGSDTGAPAKVPNDYLILKTNGKYSVYGLYSLRTQLPQCLQLSVPSIIFQEVKDRVILCSRNMEYEEICRKLPATRYINNVIAELTDDFLESGCIGGVVWQFDEKTKSLQKLYEGNFRALGFSDGSIIGDNGWEYTPQDDNGFEYSI